MEQTTAIHRAIAKHGSEQRLAGVIGVSQVAINKAKKRVEAGKPLSPRLAAAIADDIGIPRHELRPDLWPAPEKVMP